MASYEGKGIFEDFPNIKFAFGGGAAIYIDGELQDLAYIMDMENGQRLSQIQTKTYHTGIGFDGEELYIAVTNNNKEVKGQDMGKYMFEVFGISNFVVYDGSTISQMYINPNFSNNIQGIHHPRAVGNYLVIRVLE